jgi:hypothetical protein
VLKQSSNDKLESMPEPNWKGGQAGMSRACDLKDTELVELFLARRRDGRLKMDFLRLQVVSRGRSFSVSSYSPSSRHRPRPQDLGW